MVSDPAARLLLNRHVTGKLMPRYDIQGNGKDSGRKRTCVYSAANEDAARQLAEVDGITVEKIVELPPDMPTEPQLDYAKNLGIAIPAGATKTDISSLISMKVEGINHLQNAIRVREKIRY